MIPIPYSSRFFFKFFFFKSLLGGAGSLILDYSRIFFFLSSISIRLLSSDSYRVAVGSCFFLGGKFFIKVQVGHLPPLPPPLGSSEPIPHMEKNVQLPTEGLITRSQKYDLSAFGSTTLIALLYLL